jgi:hypothetical protein
LLNVLAQIANKMGLQKQIILQEGGIAISWEHNFTQDTLAFEFLPHALIPL